MEHVEQLLGTALAAQTKKTYAHAFKMLQQFVNCTFHIDICLPTTVDTLTFFIAHMHSKRMASSTICTYTTAIGYINQLAGHKNPVESFLIKKLLAGVKRGSFRSDQRLPVTPYILSKLAESLQYTAESIYQRRMLQAMYLLAFHAFLRIGEISNNKSITHVLQLGDIQFFQDSRSQVSKLEITFRSFKANYNIRPVVLSLNARGKRSDTCPVGSLYNFVELRGTFPGPLFCFPPDIPISYAYFCSCLNKALVWAGLCPSQYKSHSFRIGAASTAAAQGISDEDIQHMGRWKSIAFKRYIRLPTLYNMNA